MVTKKWERLAESAGLQRPDVKLENSVRSGNGDSVRLPSYPCSAECTVLYKASGATHSNRLDNAAESPRVRSCTGTGELRHILSIHYSSRSTRQAQHIHEESPNTTRSLGLTHSRSVRISRRPKCPSVVLLQFTAAAPLRGYVITWAFAELLVIQESGRRDQRVGGYSMTDRGRIKRLEQAAAREGHAGRENALSFFQATTKHLYRSQLMEPVPPTVVPTAPDLTSWHP